MKYYNNRTTIDKNKQWTIKTLSIMVIVKGQTQVVRWVKRLKTGQSKTIENVTINYRMWKLLTMWLKCAVTKIVIIRLTDHINNT